MSRKFLFIVTISLGIIWTVGVTILSFKHGQETINNMQKLYLERMSGMGQVLVSSIRSDLLRGNTRQAIRTLEGFRGTKFLSGFRIESPNIDKIYTGINQHIKSSDVVHTETITYSMEPPNSIWGKVDFIFSTDEVEKLRSDLTSNVIIITLITTLSVASIILLIGIAFDIYNHNLFTILEKTLIDRRLATHSKLLRFIFNPLLKMVETVRMRLDLVEIDRQAYVQNITLYKTSRQIAHDIQGPLTFMKFFAKRYENSNPEDAKNIFLATDRLEKMGMHLLNTGISSNNYSLPIKLFIDRIMEYIKYKSEEVPSYKVKFHNYFSNLTNEQIQMDYLLLERAIDNLVNNAIDAIRNTSHDTVTIGINAANEGLRITVTDHGPGMIATAIDAFNSDKSGFTSKSTGHGIGLPFCKQVIYQAGGKLEYTYSPDLGSTFSISIPFFKSPQTKEDITLSRT